MEALLEQAQGGTVACTAVMKRMTTDGTCSCVVNQAWRDVEMRAGRGETWRDVGRREARRGDMGACDRGVIQACRIWIIRGRSRRDREARTERRKGGESEVADV